ncbi:glycosyl transferase family 2 [Halovivax gelatinilyticus]|uniref:glycosyl transferase family 2 n=1 Tax=Halovivax gelatinilyticus TaxID=2961597 RepID=UPI0020CA5CBA|nr:glycosyl transferase family 2 [Halovivax gelatinilyticus]
MEYVQERITTLHDLTGRGPPAIDRTLAETAVVVPMTDREHASLATERVLSTLERVDVAEVFVPVRAPADRIEAFDAWLRTFDLPLTTLWCNAPAVERRLADVGLDDEAGKGHDVWLALGPAADAAASIVVHDADVASYDRHHVERLLTPLSMGYEFSKGYYARVENDQLYGRLYRLLYAPLLRALADEHDSDVIEYLDSFRYALAGEFAMSQALARTVRPPRSWGLEVGTLGDAYAHAGFADTAQVDLGRHEHDHRAVAGETGLEGMSRSVAETLFQVLESNGVEPTYVDLRERYLAAGDRLVEQYRADARYNSLAYDAADERSQLRRYVDAIEPPGPDRRRPSWEAAPLDPVEIVELAKPIAEGETRPIHR